MKIGAVADCHVGNHRIQGGPVTAGLNDRCRETIRILRSAYVRAGALGCDAFFVLGDLFDTDHPTPQILTAVREALTGNLPAFILLGNHDMTSNAAGDHALGPLDGCSLIEVVSTPQVIRLPRGYVACLPYRPGNARDWALPEAQALRQGLGSNAEDVVLVTHLGLIDDATPPWLKDAHDAVPRDTFDFLGYQAKLAGNWHSRKAWEHNTLQVGALVPTGWDNPGLDGYGTLAIWDEKSGLNCEVLPGPRFVKTRSQAEAEAVAQRALADGHTLHLRVVGEMPVLTALPGGSLTVEADTDEAGAAARSAAHAARHSSSLEESLANYVQAMELPDGVRALDVLSRCREFLK